MRRPELDRCADSKSLPRPQVGSRVAAQANGRPFLSQQYYQPIAAREYVRTRFPVLEHSRRFRQTPILANLLLSPCHSQRPERQVPRCLHSELHSSRVYSKRRSWPQAFFKYWSMALRIRALTGAPVFSERALSLFSCSSVTRRLVSFFASFMLQPCTPSGVRCQSVP